MLTPKRVLCVDDHEDTCVLMKTLLTDFEVVTSPGVVDGLRLAATEKFDLIVLDYYLQDGTGLDLCSSIRKFDLTTPILLVTVTHRLSHEQVVAVGGQGVMRKDHLALLLPDAIARLLELKL